MTRAVRRLIQVALDWTRPKDPPLSLGHASILANLKKHNIPFTQASWAINQPNFNPRSVVDFALEHNDCETDFAIGAFVWNESSVQYILKALKSEGFKGNLIVGGPQISYVRENADLEKFYPDADVFIRGYAETVMVALMQSKNQAPLKGVHYRGIPNLSTIATADLNELPSPYLTGLIIPQTFTRWETHRGCQFGCSFCQHRAPDREVFEKKYINRDRIYNEITWFVENGVEDIAVLDPVFNSGPYYLNTIERITTSGYRGKIALQARADMVTTEFIHSLKKLNDQAAVTLEFGLQTIHPEEQRIINRANNLKKFERNVKALLDIGLNIEISLIFGLPNQTIQSFKKSIQFCKELRVQTIHAFPLMLLRGTELFDRKKELGLVESNEIANNKIPRIQDDITHVVTSPSFSYDDWKEMAKYAAELEEDYNKQRKPVSAFFSSPATNHAPPLSQTFRATR